MNSEFSNNRAAAAEAAVWIARLQREDRDAALEQEFRKWLRSDAAHAAAFEEATTVWNQLPGVGSLYREAEQRRGRWKQFAIAATLLVVTGLAFLAFSLRGEVYATAVGEQRMVKLEDGSWITLNTDTVIRTRYDRATRSVTLERGEALFDVAKEGNRAFIVSAGGEAVRAVGTSFIVRADGEAVSVALLEGRVVVDALQQPVSGEKAPATAMSAGQFWRSQDRTLVDMGPARLDEMTAWRHGESVFNDVALRDAAAEMNRYTEKPLIIQTPSTGSLPVTGVFKIRDHEAFAQTVAALHGLRVRVEPQRILIADD